MFLQLNIKLMLNFWYLNKFAVIVFAALGWSKKTKRAILFISY